MKLFETFFIFLLFQNSFVFPFDSASVNSIAYAFIYQYYYVYDTNREGLAGFYVSLKLSFGFPWAIYLISFLYRQKNQYFTLKDMEVLDFKQ